MRRSIAVGLTLLAGAGLGLAFYDAEPDTDTDGVLESQAACVQRLGDDAAGECGDVFQAAAQTHAATAPRFASADACRTATGAECTTLAGTGGTPWAAAAASVFVPVMAGVMIGRALSDGTRGAIPVYAGAPPSPDACPPTMQGQAGCPAPARSGSTTSTSSGGRYWYSGSSYAGYSDSGARGGFSRAATTAGAGTLLARSSPGTSGSGYRAGSGSRAGGFGASAAAHGSSGS